MTVLSGAINNLRCAVTEEMLLHRAEATTYVEFTDFGRDAQATGSLTRR
jgi:hypothetical protein